MYLCLMNLSKAGGSVSRELLWEVLARLVYQPRWFQFIRQFYDGMRVRVCTDGGSHLKWFTFSQGLLGLHDVTVAVLHVLRRFLTRCPCVPQRGRRHRAEPSPTRRRWTRQSRGIVGMGVKAALTTLVCAACFTPPPTAMSRDRQKVSRSSEGLAKMIATIKTVFEAAGPTHSEKKTVTMLPHTRDLAFRDVHLSSKKQDICINRYSISIPRRRYQRRR